MLNVAVTNEQSLLPISEDWIREVVRTTLWAEQVAGAEIVVALVDDAAIHVVNRDHLQHDYPTDVISFLYDAEPEEPVDADVRGAGRHLDGEIVVSVETAQRQAKLYGWQAEDELRLYIAHGLLHLCGYDDLVEAEQQVMRNRERAVLSKWGLTPHYDE